RLGRDRPTDRPPALANAAQAKARPRGVAAHGFAPEGPRMVRRGRAQPRRHLPVRLYPRRRRGGFRPRALSQCDRVDGADHDPAWARAAERLTRVAPRGRWDYIARQAGRSLKGAAL